MKTKRRDDEILRIELDFYSPEELEDMELGADAELLQLGDEELYGSIETMELLGDEDPNWHRQIKRYSEEIRRRNSPLVQPPGKARCPQCGHLNETSWPWCEICGYGEPEEACAHKRPKLRGPLCQHQ